jgi:hypothetical protein
MSVTYRWDVSTYDRRWFEEALPADLESMEEYQQVAGAWARSLRSASPYHGPAYGERAARLHKLFSDFEERVTHRKEVADSGDGGFA